MPEHKTVRRSVALPGNLLEQVMEAAPTHLRGNFNRLVVVSLLEFVQRRNQETFESAMAAMAADPAIRAECASIGEDFASTGMDGLKS